MPPASHSGENKQITEDFLMLNQNLKPHLKPLMSVFVCTGAIALATVSPAFGQIMPEPLQPTVEPLQPAGMTIQLIAPQTSPVPDPATNANSGSSITPIQLTGQFTFTNALEYSDCLEDILRLYQAGTKFRLEERRSTCRDDIFQAYRNRPLPKEEALELIQMALPQGSGSGCNNGLGLFMRLMQRNNME
jgi:hypothetical protein